MSDRKIFKKDSDYSCTAFSEEFEIEKDSEGNIVYLDNGKPSLKNIQLNRMHYVHRVTDYVRWLKGKGVNWYYIMVQPRRDPSLGSIRYYRDSYIPDRPTDFSPKK